MINVAEKLRNAPIGLELDSAYGKCLYQGLTEDDYIKVILTEQNNVPFTFNKYGCNWSMDDLALYPSEDNDDWELFNAPTGFKPFDKVLARAGYKWTPTFFSFYDEDNETYNCMGVSYKECIAYNEDNAFLTGTSKEYL